MDAWLQPGGWHLSLTHLLPRPDGSPPSLIWGFGVAGWLAVLRMVRMEGSIYRFMEE